MSEYFDVIIIGGGLSGIGAAYHLQTNCPRKSYIILEARDRIGGTWDLFRYPGIRSDSDMYTFGYSFRPWRAKESIAHGSSILDYIRDTASAYGIDRKIRFGQRVVSADWSSTEALWTLHIERGPAREPTELTCRFLLTCTGYYDYAKGYEPEFAAKDSFRGRIVHPQHWPEDLDYAGKRVVVVGSGATAVTLVPAMAETAAHVTMLQRSPTYIVARPARDPFANWLSRHLPTKPAYTIVRWRNVLLGLYFYNLCRRKPDRIKRWLVSLVGQQLGPDYDIARHFTPRYNPWDQRLCLAPDADFFRAMRAGKAEVVTDEIERFTETGLQLRSGRALTADVVVTATGLRLQLLGGMNVNVDGDAINFAETVNYKGAMYSNVPNLASIFGYTNASWTLKSDLTSAYICRLINHMDSRGYLQCTPRPRDPGLATEPLIDFSSGYIRRSIDQFPRQGSKKPWRLYQNYVLDLISLRLGSIGDGALEFSRPAKAGT